MTDTAQRWTQIEHLPNWDEEFYDIYTAKKLGKWVMLKTLKPQYRELPEYRAMIEKEFDVRYNLAHPNIVMINDFEEVPGVGLSIITDDVYGDTLRTLINEKRVTAAHIGQMRHQLVSALQYIEANHIVHPPLRPENIIFTENIGNLKLIDVGFEQRPSLPPDQSRDDIYYYGQVLKEALDAAGMDDPVLRRIAARCTSPITKYRYRNLEQLHLALEDRSSRRLYILLSVFIVAMIILVIWLLSPYRPDIPQFSNIPHMINLLCP